MSKGATYIYEGALPVSIGFCHSKKVHAEEMKRLGVKDQLFLGSPDHHAELQAVYHESGTKLLFCVDCKRKTSLAQFIGTIAHEATHALQRIIEAMAEEKPGREFEAYTVQYLTQHAYNHFIKYRKKSRR